ncbi:MAG: hypothetical protein ACOCUT_01570 [bacterium]
MNQFRDKFDEWAKWYNQKYPHSANKYKSPYQVERDYVNNMSQLNCA